MVVGFTAMLPAKKGSSLSLPIGKRPGEKAKNTFPAKTFDWQERGGWRQSAVPGRGEPSRPCGCSRRELWHTCNLEDNHGGVLSEASGTFTAQDLIVVRDEALAHEGGSAAGAAEAVVVPVAILKGDVLASPKTRDGLCAGTALFGIKAAEALDAVGLILLRCELLPGQGSLTACADKALLVPRLIPVGHSSLGQRLLAAGAAGGKFALVAGDAVIFVLLRDEGACSNGLLAAAADEAVLMPGLPVVLQLPRAWHDHLLAGHALGGELPAVAAVAEQLLPLAGEGLIRQGAVAAEAAEAALVVVAVLVVQLPAVVSNELLALVTGVGKVGVIAGDAERTAIALDVLAPVKRLLAAGTVEAVCHVAR